MLAGTWVNGDGDPDEIAGIARTVHDGYAAGFAAEGGVVDEQAIEYTFITHLLVRAVFDAVATIADVGPPQATARVALARFAADRTLALQPLAPIE